MNPKPTIARRVGHALAEIAWFTLLFLIANLVLIGLVWLAQWLLR